MKIDLALPLPGSVDCRAEAARAERLGFAGGWTSEIAHDPFLALALAATETARLELGTAIAVAFARSPMSVAVQAHDLQRLSAGRLRLGLGTQVKAHITRRYAMPWTGPVARMREYVGAVRAIWSAWEQGGPLRFEGEFYRHTLMPPAFAPPPHGHPPPPILLSGVGPRMTEMAGAIADGFITHAFSTRRYLHDVTLPALRRGRGARTLDGFELVVMQHVATGRTERELAAAVERVRERVAFYGSTPAYRNVLAVHGREDLADALHARSREGRWHEMAALVDDELLHEVAIVAEPEGVVGAVRRRHGQLADRVSLYLPYGVSAELLERIAAGLDASSPTEA